MLQKIDVATQVTGLRPKIKQAIVHLAHHLSREIKKCDKRKGKMADKFRRKAETSRREVVMLREIDPDVVSRYALMMDFSEREKLLGDINLPLDTKVKVKLSTFKPVVSHVENFRAAHSNWRSDLPELLESLGNSSNKKKEKLKQKEESIEKHQKKKALKKISKTESVNSSTEAVQKKKNTVLKTIKKPPSLKRKVAEGIVNEDGNEGNTTDTNEDGSDDEDSKANVKYGGGEEDAEEEVYDDEVEDNDDDDEDGDDDEEEDDNDEEEEDDVSEGQNEYSSSESLNEKEEMFEIGEGKELRKPVNSTLLKNKNGPRISSASKFAEVRRFADLQLEEEQQKNERKPQDLPQNSDKYSENELSDNEPGEEDTFFMTGENKFLKTVAIKRDNGEGLSSDKSTCPFPNLWTTDGKQLKGNRAQRRAKFLGRPLDKRQLKKLNNKNDYMSNRFVHNNGDRFNRFNINSEVGSVKKNFRRNEFSSSQLEQSDPAEKLHPSWEAKRKQKISLNNFQGKKIKFGDDNAVDRSTELPKTKTNLSSNNQSDPGEKLHPSWEAKRKQKISFDNFQGKKVKFDDD